MLRNHTPRARAHRPVVTGGATGPRTPNGIMHASIISARRSRDYPSPWKIRPASPFLWHWFREQSRARADGQIARSDDACRPSSDLSGPVSLHIEVSQAPGPGTSAASVRDSGSAPWPSPGGKHDGDDVHLRPPRPHRDGTEGSAPGGPQDSHRGGELREHQLAPWWKPSSCPAAVIAA